MKTRNIMAALLFAAATAVMADDYNFLTISCGGEEQNIALPVIKKITFAEGRAIVTTSEGSHSYPLSILDKMTFTYKDNETGLQVLPEQSENLSFANGKLSVKGSGLLCVYNTGGALVSVVNVEEGANVNLGDLPDGVYVVRMGNQTIKLKK